MVGGCFRSDMLIWRGGWVFQERHVDMEGWAGVSGVTC